MLTYFLWNVLHFKLSIGILQDLGRQGLPGGGCDNHPQLVASGLRIYGEGCHLIDGHFLEPRPCNGHARDIHHFAGKGGPGDILPVEAKFHHVGASLLWVEGDRILVISLRLGTGGDLAVIDSDFEVTRSSVVSFH